MTNEFEAEAFILGEKTLICADSSMEMNQMFIFIVVMGYTLEVHFNGQLD
jgi:hypothetical protein